MSKAINPMLLCDFYKTVHSDMINPKMTKSMSYYTPRMSRVKRWDKVVMFGVQMFCRHGLSIILMRISLSLAKMRL